jgi:cell division protein FtsL
MIRRFIFQLLILPILASAILYHTSDRMRVAEARLNAVNRQIAATQEEMHILKAEWAYLSEPRRVGTLAKKHLTGLQQTETAQVMTLTKFAASLPPVASQPISRFASLDSGR